MNQTISKETPRAVRRNGNNPVFRKRSVPVAKWKARVKVTSKGPNRADRQRKVDNTRTVQVPLDDVLGDLIARLRSGEDVRFTLNGREALRVFPCLSADYETMYAAVNTTGELKSCLKDVEFEMVDKDSAAIRPETAKAERCRRNELIHVRKEEDRNGVVPKRVFKSGTAVLRMSSPASATTERESEMAKLTKTERETFEAIGAAICDSKNAAKPKKAKMPLVADFIAKNHDALEAGLVIGNYKFTLVTREELTAIRIDEPKEGN